MSRPNDCLHFGGIGALECQLLCVVRVLVFLVLVLQLIGKKFFVVVVLGIGKKKDPTMDSHVHSSKIAILDRFSNRPKKGEF